MNIYTVTTRLDNHKFLIGVTDNPKEYVKKFFGQAEFVKNGINDTIHYKYFGAMKDSVELVFTKQTTDLYFSISLQNNQNLWI